MKDDKYKGKRYEIELNVHNDFTPSLVSTHEDIKEVYLQARGTDGWYVESIATFTAGTNKKYTKMTTDQASVCGWMTMRNIFTHTKPNRTSWPMLSQVPNYTVRDII